MKTYDEEQARAECRGCSWSASGSMWRVEDKADEHETDTGHRVDVKAKDRI